MFFAQVRDFILTYGWLILIALSIYIIINGRHVYKLVKDSLVGNVVKALVYTILVDLSCLGIIFLLIISGRTDEINTIFLVFVLWIIIFIWTLVNLKKTGNEISRIVNQDKKK